MPAGKISENNTRINVTIPKYLKLQAEIIATKQNRSLSNLIVTLIKDYVQLMKKTIPNKYRLYIYLQLFICKIFKDLNKIWFTQFFELRNKFLISKIMSPC